MNTLFTQLEGNVSHPAHEYLFTQCGSVIPLNSLLPSFPGSPPAQATESWAEPGHESLEDAVYNRTVYSVFVKNF